MIKIILASKSKVRKEILDKNNITSQVEPSNVDEDIIKKNLLNMIYTLYVLRILIKLKKHFYIVYFTTLSTISS